MDPSVYNQQATPHVAYGSPLYMQQVYSAQQQYPVYAGLTQSWNATTMPYFETPLVRAIITLFFFYFNLANYKIDSVICIADLAAESTVKLRKMENKSTLLHSYMIL